MTDAASSSESSPQKRRSTRLVQAIPLMVIGTDALGQPFKERTSTLLISCHGCKYQSKHYVPVGCSIVLEIPRPEAEQRPRSVRARVVWVQRPRTIRELFQIGVELDEPGNIWGIAFPPKDWFLPREEGPEIPAPASQAAGRSEEKDSRAQSNAAPTPILPAEEKDSRAQESAAPRPTLAAEDRVRTLPSPATQMPMAMARQMARMLAEAKQHLQNGMQDAAAAAVSEQLRAMRDQLDAHLRSSVQAAVEVGVAQSLEQTIERAVERSLAARLGTQPSTAPTPQGPDAEEVAHQMEAAAQSRLAEWQGELEDAAGPLRRQFQSAFEQATRDAQKTMDALCVALEEERQRAAASLEATQQGIARAEQSAAELAATTESKVGEVRQRVERLLAAQCAELERHSQEAAAQLAATMESKVGEAQQRAEALLTRNAELERHSEQAAAQLAATTESQVAEVRRRVVELERSAEQAAAQLAATTESQVAEAGRRVVELKRSAEQAAAQLAATTESKVDEVQQRVEALLAAQCAELERSAERSAAQLAASTEWKVAEAQQHAEALLKAQHAELERRADSIVAGRARQLEPALKEAARQFFERISTQLEEQLQKQLTPHLEQTQRAAAWLASAEKHAEQAFARASGQFEEQLQQQAGAHLRRTHQATIALAAAEQRAEEVERGLRDRLQKAADEAQQAALGRIKEQMAGYPAEFEQACRAALAKVEEELDAKTTEATQTTFEALYKSSEWYQKKAQTSMQSTLEKLTDQAGNALRDQAAEVSRLFASELDHYSRNYGEHTKGLMEESAKETADRGRSQLSQMAETTMASFADEVHGVAGRTLDQFEQAARQSAEHSQTVFRAQCGTSLAEVQKRLSDLITDAVAQARQNLQAQLPPVMERFKTQFEGQQRAALDQFAQTSNEAIEQYKARLENASNSWLLASATTLGQHSQAVLETLTQAAETRLRETCAQVFASFGEALRQRLAGLSAELQPPAEPPEKK